jgi:hypothetical protein
VLELRDDVVGEFRLTGGAQLIIALREQQVTGFNERTLCLQPCDLFFCCQAGWCWVEKAWL